MVPRRQGSRLASSVLCGQERETGSVPLKVGDWAEAGGRGRLVWAGGRGMSPARQLAELGPRGDGYWRGPKWWQLFLNIVPGTRSRGSGQTVGELGPCQEVWSHPAAAAAH